MVTKNMLTPSASFSALHDSRQKEPKSPKTLPTEHIKYAPKYRCEACDYECSRKFLWKQHCATRKHKMVTNGNINPDETIMVTKPCYECPKCRRCYKHRSGLSRHLNRTPCGAGLNLALAEEAGGAGASEDADSLTRENGELRAMVKQLMAGLSNDAAAREEMVGQLKEQSQIIKDMIPRLGSNNNNNFSINVFLNEQCRDAINMTEFIASLQVQLDDLRFTGNNGLIEGVSSVLVNGLKRLERCRRPIHCMDTKREVLYIKDDDVWNADGSNERLRSAIGDVANKQRKAIADWEAHNPNWDSTEEGRAEYLKLVRSVMADISHGEDEGKIIRSIAKETAVPGRALDCGPGLGIEGNVMLDQRKQ